MSILWIALPQAMHCGTGPGKFMQSTFPETFMRMCTALYHIARYSYARRIKATHGFVRPLLQHLLHVLRSPAVEAELKGLTTHGAPPDSTLRKLAIEQGHVQPALAPTPADSHPSGLK